MNISIRTPDEEDINYILGHPSVFSREEIDEYGFMLKVSLKTADYIFCGCVNDKPICLGAVERGSLLAESNYVWIVLARRFDKFPFIFLRQSKKLAQRLLTEYAVLTAIVRCDNPKAIKWLEWLGFERGREEQFGKFRGYRMTLRRA